MRRLKLKTKGLRKVAKFFRDYRQLGLTLLAAIVAGALALAGLNGVSNWLLIISVSVNLLPLVWGMIQDLRTGTYGVDILAATAIVTALIMNEYWAAIVIILMLIGGEALEDYAQERAKTELSDLLKRAPKKAHLLRGRKVIEVKVSEIQAKDKILIKPGEVVPVDAVIIEGSANFDESSLTGESLPLTKDNGQQILSGSINIDGAITAQALRTAEDSQYEQIIKLVKSAASTKSPFVRMADRYSIPFTIAAFTIAGSAWAISGESLRFLQVLVVATPCPLIFGAPVAMISGMSRAAKNGIIVKNGRSFERLASIKTLGFDKTGTLTAGQPALSSIKTYSGFSEDAVLSAAAALEKKSTHILAKAIIEAAELNKIKIKTVKNLKEFSGRGLSGIYAGKPVLIGRLVFLADHNTEIPSSLAKNPAPQTATFVAISGKLAGILLFEDMLRPETQSTLEAIRKFGIKKTLMVTGDNFAAAHNIARQLGINNVFAEALPADKLTAIENVKLRPVGFVGDGVNDAPVLATADVGIALGARGSTAASESADVVIMKDDLGQVAVAIAVAKRTMFIARQSIFIGIGLSVGLMLIYSTGRFSAVSGALVQEAVDVIVIFNALRAHGTFRSKKDKLLAID